MKNFASNVGGFLRLLVLGSLALTPQGAMQGQVHTASGGRVNYTFLDSARFPPAADRVFMVTSLVGADEVRVSAPLGIWLSEDGAAGLRPAGWAIYTQDRSPIPAGAQFVVRSFSPGSNAFVHEANTSGFLSYIENPACNDRPNAILQVIAQYSPTATSSGYNSSQIALWYDDSRGRWAIFNQNESSIAQGMRFHVVVDPIISGKKREVRSFRGNSAFNGGVDRIYLGRSGDSFNLWPNFAEVYLTPRFSYDPSIFACPSGCPPLRPGQAVQLNRPVAARYDTLRRKWFITTEDGSSFPASTSFNVVVVSYVP